MSKKCSLCKKIFFYSSHEGPKRWVERIYCSPKCAISVVKFKKTLDVKNTAKKCHRCNEIKIKNKFNKDKTKSDGYDSKCKDCSNIYYNRNKSKIKIVVEKKICIKCEEEKKASEFGKKSDQKDGLQYYCKDCYNRRTRRDKYPRRYGITLEEKEAMILAQNNKCAICQVTLVKACVDHDHKTGKIRKILCHYCNQGLGSFKDDPELLLQATSYLTSFS